MKLIAFFLICVLCIQGLVSTQGLILERIEYRSLDNNQKSKRVLKDVTPECDASKNSNGGKK